MTTTRALLILSLVAITVFASAALGGAPMGPPIATLGEGRWSVGGEYGREEIDLDAWGTVHQVLPDETSVFWSQLAGIEGLTSNMFLGTLAYGVCDNWDIFVRLGAADAADEIVARPADYSATDVRDSFSGSYGFAWGAGSRATFCRSGPWSFGGLVQVTWFKPGTSDFSVADPFLPDETWTGDMELDYWQTQVELAAAYQMDTWQFWAGPFLQFVRGDMDFSGQSVLGEGGGVSSLNWSSELQESSQIGAHVGASWDATDQWGFWVEGQLTGDSWLLGVGAVFMPEETFGM